MNVYLQKVWGYRVAILVLVLAVVPKTSAMEAPVRLLVDEGRIAAKKMTLVDFSAVACCRILSSEYQARGVVFDNAVTSGWATYQANGFASHLSSVSTLPGAPLGSTGTRLVLTKPTKRVGMYVQAGSPFVLTSARPMKGIVVRAYDSKGKKIFEQVTDTCLGGGTSCTPQFVGVESAAPIIKAMEVVMNAPVSWTIDNLKWEAR